MNIELAENSIKQQLIDNFAALSVATTIKVDLLPENQADYKKGAENTRIYVCYAESNFDKPKSMGIPVQSEEANFQIVIMSKRLRGKDGIYDAFRLTNNAVLGFEPKNCRRIYALKFEYQKIEDNVFSYIYTVACGSELVMDYDEIPVNTPVFKEIRVTPVDPGYDGISISKDDDIIE